MKENIEKILMKYQHSFTTKIYPECNHETDMIMDLFGITPELKEENRQYWGRELGMVWELVVKEIFRSRHPEYQEALKFGAEEPCDFQLGSCAIDTKYRIGSGDSGTLRKMRENGLRLQNAGYQRLLLILREDNLPAALSAAKNGGWLILVGQDTLDFIESETGINIRSYLQQFGEQFIIDRNLSSAA